MKDTTDGNSLKEVLEQPVASLIERFLDPNNNGFGKGVITLNVNCVFQRNAPCNRITDTIFH